MFLLVSAFSHSLLSQVEQETHVGFVHGVQMHFFVQGKTTVLNALFRNKYGETSMKRATAGVSYFRIQTNSQSATAAEVVVGEEEMDADTRSAKSIFQEISLDNIQLRESETVVEKTFDIQLTTELVPMMKDVQLVFVDIPGINEANAEHKYTNYVSQKWETFDMVVVVMDAKQGVNTEDSVFLLNLVKENNKTYKDIPVIILCNKVDDLDDEEQMDMVTEARKEVEKIFQVPCRQKALESVLQGDSKTSIQTSPVFIPISAIHAYTLQSASLMNRDAFIDFDKDLLEKLGREQVGRRRWNKMSEQEKLDEAFEIIKEYHVQGIKDCNFDKFLSSISYFIGGEAKQLAILDNQIKTFLSSISERPPTAGKISDAVKQAYEKSKGLAALSKDKVSILSGARDPAKIFWTAFSKLEDKAFDDFKNAWPTGFDKLAGPMEELESYCRIVVLKDWNDDVSTVLGNMKKYLRRIFAFLIERQALDRTKNKWDSIEDFYLAKDTKGMTPQDWSLIWGSYCIMGHNRHFCEDFGKEKILFERMAQDAHAWGTMQYSVPSDQDEEKGKMVPKNCFKCRQYLSSTGYGKSKYCSSCYLIYVADNEPHRCVGCGRTSSATSCCRYVFHMGIKTNRAFDPCYTLNGTIQPFPKKQKVQDKRIHIKVPEHLSDCSHVAHIVSKYCECKDSLLASTKENVANLNLN
jgi:GTPase SAR1 family protein